jgi:hypothetical protein
VGTSGVTSSSYGVSLSAGSSITIDTLLPTEGIYAVSTVANSTVSILSVQR